MVVPLIYDLYPDAMEVAGIDQFSRCCYRCEIAQSGRVYEADGIVFVGRRMADHVIANMESPSATPLLKRARMRASSIGRRWDPRKQTELEVFCDEHFLIFTLEPWAPCTIGRPWTLSQGCSNARRRPLL